MPRRLPVRPAKILGNFFVLLVLTIISFVYYAYVIVLWGPRMKGKYQHIFLHFSEKYSKING